jgi:hypothetical protein
MINISIGDTVAYSVQSQYGTISGAVFIPDTVSIIYPWANDTLYYGVNFTATWHRNDLADGYFAYLENQDGLVADINELAYDTSSQFSGDYLLNLGGDRFWLETLSGVYDNEIAPNGMNLPLGVVGAAGNFREVYISFAP